MADMRKLPDGGWMNFDRLERAIVVGSGDLATFGVSAINVGAEFGYSMATGFKTREEAQQWLDDFMKGDK